LTRRRRKSRIVTMVTSPAIRQQEIKQSVKKPLEPKGYLDRDGVPGLQFINGIIVHAAKPILLKIVKWNLEVGIGLIPPQEKK